MKARGKAAKAELTKRIGPDATRVDAMNAIAYICDANERLIDAFINEDAKELLTVMSCINAALSHLRAIHPEPVDIERTPRGPS